MNKNLFYLFFIVCMHCINPVLAQQKPTVSAIKMGWYYPTINAVISRTDFQVALNFWVEEFSKAANVEHHEIRIFDHMENMQTAFNKGELNIIVANPLLIAKYFDLNMLADGFAGTNKNDPSHGIVVLARKDKHIRQISDFKGKKLVLPEGDELAQIFLDSLLIPQFQQDYQQVFSSVQLLKKQNAIIHSLFFGKADVGVAYLETFDLMVELNPQIKDKTIILDIFPIDSPNYSFFHYQFPEEERKLLMAAILDLNNSVRSRQILSDFRIATLVECPVESLKPFIRLNKRYEQLKQQISKGAQ